LEIDPWTADHWHCSSLVQASLWGLAPLCILRVVRHAWLLEQGGEAWAKALPPDFEYSTAAQDVHTDS
jgi:hypothetical protein